MENGIFALVLSIFTLSFLFQTWLNVLNYRNRHAEIPKEVSDVYNKGDYRKWLNYTMENNRFVLIRRSIDFALFLGLLVFGFFPFLNNIATELVNSPYAQTIVFIGFYFIIEFILSTAFAYYDAFKIEEKYGFNKTTPKTFITDRIKNLLLTIIIGGGLIFILRFMYEHAGDLFYLFAWLLIIGFVLFINMFYVKLFVPLFNKLSPMEDGELKNKIIDFADNIGYEITKISVIDASKRSTKLNAFFSGFGKFKQVVLYDTLLEKMDDEQVLSVLAHEIGHSKRKHISKNILISVVSISLYLFVLIYCLKSPALGEAFGFEGAHFGFGLVIFMVLISPISIFLQIITSKISRTFEYQADHFAAIHGFKKPMQTSLKILARENFSNLTPHPLFVAFNYSHPPIADRIRAIKKIDV